MGRFGMGQAVSRLEDPRLLRGEGCFTDDIVVPSVAHGVVVRSPHAHARIMSVSTDRAMEMPGVLAVYTAADLDAAGVGEIRCHFTPASCGADGVALTSTPILSRDKVRLAGDAVAFVVAETLLQARDAALEVEVGYEELESVSSAIEARRGGGAQIWPQAPGNQCFVAELGDRAATDEAMAGAHRVVRLTLEHNRVVVNSMESRGAIGEFKDGRFILDAGTQGVHYVRDQLAQDIFAVPAGDVLVRTGDVGGGFGMKSALYREYVMVLFAARALGRPVKWVGERSSDSFLADTQARDQVDDIELGLDDEHRFVALRVRSTSNMGAYLSNYGPGSSTDFQRSVYPGPYRLPVLHAEINGLFTNTPSIEAYRGAGRPECAYRLERVIEKAAREIGISATELRRRNFVGAEEMPYTTALGAVYDSGEFDANMSRAMELADAGSIDARKQAAREVGRRRGLGMAYYIEGCGGASSEQARVEIDSHGDVRLLIGTQSNGQGHATAYGQLVADELQVDIDRITLIQGDTDQILTGGGTTGSRSIPMGAPCSVRAAQKLIEAGRALAAEQLEVAVADLEYRDGCFRVPGTDLTVALGALVGDAGVLGRDHEFQVEEKTYPNGCHVCELEIDEETGSVRILRYLVLDDFGTVLNPMLLAGQVHGGIAQGVGQALLEHTVFDAESGQLLSGSFMDYCLPRASDVVDVEMHLNCDVPCKTNPLGIKGGGEAGTIGALPAVVNAVVDALADVGVTHVDMPVTSEKVWRLLSHRSSGEIPPNREDFG